MTTKTDELSLTGFLLHDSQYRTNSSVSLYGTSGLPVVPFCGGLYLIVLSMQFF